MMALPASRRRFQFLRVDVRVGGEESKIHLVELFGAHTLDEVNFVAHGFELAKGFVIVEQSDVDCGKIAIAQHLGDFFALERARAHDGGAVRIRARGRMRADAAIFVGPFMKSAKPPCKSEGAG